MTNDELINKYEGLSAEIASRLYRMLTEHLPQAVETVDSENIGLGLAPGYKGLVFTITPRLNYVMLGIANGANLSDPAALMQGSGKIHRHIKVYKTSDLENPALIDLINTAIKAARSRLK